MTDNTDLLLVAIIDKSSSMSGMVRAVTEGMNALIKEQVEQPGETRLTLTKFDTQIDVPYTGADARTVPALGSTQNPYHPNGNTALYDAVGVTVKGVEKWQENNPGFQGKVLVAIWTDGEENSSHLWTIERLNDLIAWKQNVDGWEFIFLGSGEGAWRTARAFTAIPQDSVVYAAADAGSYAMNYAGLSSSATSLRSTGKVDNSNFVHSPGAKKA